MLRWRAKSQDSNISNKFFFNICSIRTQVLQPWLDWEVHTWFLVWVKNYILLNQIKHFVCIFVTCPVVIQGHHAVCCVYHGRPVGHTLVLHTACYSGHAAGLLRDICETAVAPSCSVTIPKWQRTIIADAPGVEGGAGCGCPPVKVTSRSRRGPLALSELGENNRPQSAGLQMLQKRKYTTVKMGACETCCKK